MSDVQQLLQRVVPLLDAAGIPYMIAGSFASATHGLPRATQDVDIVIDPPTFEAFESFVRSFSPDEYYVDLVTARDALRRREMFNVIDNATGWKLDFIIRKNRAFSRNEFAHRQALPLLDVPVFVASPEDTIIAKLEWSKDSNGSERQRRDIAGILATNGEALDLSYIERWVRELELEDEWQAARSTEP